MTLWLAAALLLAPTPAPGPTVWAEAGGRPWTGCRERERQADGILQRVSTQSDENSGDSPWAALARDCPNAPAVLVMAAMRELSKVPRYPPQIDELMDGLGKLREAHRESRLQARSWLQRALTEAERRGEAPPVMTYYFLAYAALGLGEPAAAMTALAEAERRGEVEGWRADRAGAVAALLAGDLPRALVLAYRAREQAPSAQRVTSVYVLALVYDRAGAPEAAQRELRVLRAASSERGVVDTLLPLHERLYLNALEQQAGTNVGTAGRLWEAYLACPEPEAPERALAERRLAELRPRGSVVPSAGP